jgi:FkbM family methyltransferase
MRGSEIDQQAAADFVLPDGRRVRCPRPHSAAVLWREITGGLYAQAIRGLPADGVIVDVGANVGLASIFFTDCVPGVSVLALEPAPACFACLRENVARHAPTVTPISVAAGAAEGTSELVYYPNAPEQSTLHADAEEQVRTSRIFLSRTGMTERMRDSLIEKMFVESRAVVPVTTVAAVLDRYQVASVSLLKVDVEGGELEVLEGVGRDNWERIGRLVVEVHDRAGRLRQIAALLDSVGYEVTVEQEPLFAGSSVFGVLAQRR